MPEGPDAPTEVTVPAVPFDAAVSWPWALTVMFALVYEDGDTDVFVMLKTLEESVSPVPDVYGVDDDDGGGMALIWLWRILARAPSSSKACQTVSG
jgi:hypothetical protein